LFFDVERNERVRTISPVLYTSSSSGVIFIPR
jgi:hypothetical protein